MIRACLSPRVWLAELNHATWQVGLQHYCRIHDVCTWWPRHRSCAHHDHQTGGRVARALATDESLHRAVRRVADHATAQALELLAAERGITVPELITDIQHRRAVVVPLPADPATDARPTLQAAFDVAGHWTTLHGGPPPPPLRNTDG